MYEYQKIIKILCNPPLIAANTVVQTKNILGFYIFLFQIYSESSFLKLLLVYSHANFN